MKVNPYLNFDGNAKEAFLFYKSVFGGNFLMDKTMGEMPGSEKMTDEEQKRIMHIALPIGRDTVLMASDILPSMGHELTKGNNSYISLHPESKAEAERLFIGLSEGGEVEMPLEEQFWGDFYGSFTDKYGVKWMVNFSPKAEEK